MPTAPPAAGRRVIYHYVHKPTFQFRALERVNRCSRGAIVELDDGEAACTAGPIPRDSQGLYLAKRREESL